MMERKRLTSIAVSFVMALSAFSIPVGAFAAETDSEAADVQANQPVESVLDLESEEPESETITEETAEEPAAEENASTDAQQVQPIEVKGSAVEKKTEPKMSTYAVDQDSEKYKQYLNSEKHLADEVDISETEITGSFPDMDSYNAKMRNAGEDESMMISGEDILGAKVTAKVGDKTYTGNVSQLEGGQYTFKIAIQKAALGTPVTVTYQMGNVSKTDKLAISKWVHPKVTVKNYTYDGKYHKGTMTIKVGKETLKRGTDYYVKSGSFRNVGFGAMEVYSTYGSKYRFGIDDGSFRINPKGTSVKKLKRAKKAFTVTWNKQAMKMSKSRITGYQIQYSTSKKFTKKTTKTITVKGYKNTSKKIKKLKKKTKYYVKVRTYKSFYDLKFCSPWSKVKVVKTK